jgi:hypothetical protein
MDGFDLQPAAREFNLSRVAEKSDIRFHCTPSAGPGARFRRDESGGLLAK